MKNFIAGPCLTNHFVGLKLGLDVLEQIAPLGRWESLSIIEIRPFTQLHSLRAVGQGQ